MRNIFLLFFILNPNAVLAQCMISGASENESPQPADALYQILARETVCPQNVFQLKDVLSQTNLIVEPAMVANRGRNNPRFGSFSFFETVHGTSPKVSDPVAPGEFFFGHFTHVQNGVVDLDQAPRPGKLLIELIAWDYRKGMFNFYEMIGTAVGAQWFYRGDSADAYADNVFLKRQRSGEDPEFGSRMRCSACHTSGGPIMKELESPHNDWWNSDRPLEFANNGLSSSMQLWLQRVVSAEAFSKNVKSGMQKLLESDTFQTFQKTLSLQEQLRPLFCAMEINLTSASATEFSNVANFNVSSAYWVNPLLFEAELAVSSAAYWQSIVQVGMQFPETNLLDADHFWLAPVKGYSDLQAIEKLVQQGLIDSEFVADVLAIDFENPLFSPKRCALLKSLPSSDNNWQQRFLANLMISDSEQAVELVGNLTLPERNRSFYQDRVRSYLARVQADLVSSVGLQEQILQLDFRRQSVFLDEISQNPRGQILEPGFRVIFPKIGN